ncbi:hypothetical protein CVT26_000085 [Gymnopilus dilepis]|uniref:Fatty acid desaturase domain-containing protein n=1 Tax=Gymnopilus dilepis TaxID=231916 RepID=A0A409VGP1_9AGAR|nr:hypothetical protein CVT26_000085 [Gymnopilus dilepis]
MSKPSNLSLRTRKKVFKPTDVNLRDISSRIPSYLHEPDTLRGLSYLVRDIACVAVFWTLAARIETSFKALQDSEFLLPLVARVGIWLSWCLYWYFQSLAMTALWVLGHECGHRAFSSSRMVCDVVGYFTHSFTGTPYFSWKITHHVHHSFHGSFERDAHHVPKTRSDLGIPSEGPGQSVNYMEYLEDTPFYTIAILMIHQFIGFPLYIATNLGGQRHFPSWCAASTSKWAVLASDVGILSVIAACVFYSRMYGWPTVFKYYIIPWLGVNHWIPHYRAGAWTFTRGAACTIDRPLLGNLGRFFFHDVAHFHVAHHLFPRMPFYHTEEATQYIKEALGEHYLSHEEYWIPNLWRSFMDCQFVEDEGDILFYKDKNGEALYDVTE